MFNDVVGIWLICWVRGDFNIYGLFVEMVELCCEPGVNLKSSIFSLLR